MAECCRAELQHNSDVSQALGAGAFYGAVQARREACGAIFTDLSHRAPRKLPRHSHELPFFGLLLEGYYGEHYGREQKQFSPFTIMFRPSDIPHQDEIGPMGVKFFEIELRPSWRKHLADCSAALNFPCEDCSGGELLWLGMKLFHEVHGPADNLVIESLLSELLAKAARMPRQILRERPPWLLRVIEKITMEHSQRLMLDELSSEACVHPVHLSRVFRKFVGMGIGEYVRRLRIRSACEQMLDPETSMVEISIAAGFADQSHFTRAFRQTTGLTPARFRALSAKGAFISDNLRRDWRLQLAPDA